MKNGLLIYYSKNKKDKNIGDYIQSVAAEHFAGKDVVLVEREHLHEYNGEPIKLIMNAWWMHYPKNWPPSNKIIPFFTSFHINPEKIKDMLSEEGIKYLKKHEPIGCRDKGTEKLLLSKGIKAYYSGCLTMTLGIQFKHSPKPGKVCFVEPYFDKKVRLKKLDNITYASLKLLFNYQTIKKIAQNLNWKTDTQSLLRFTLLFYKPYSKYFSKKVLANAEYINHMVHEPSFPNEKSKFDYAKMLLKKYAESEFVITSRIHAALPCLGIGTPTAFVTNDYFNTSSNTDTHGRFEGVLNLLNVFEYKNLGLKPMDDFKINKKVTFGNCDSIKNKSKHLHLVDNLINQCRNFIKS